MQDRGQGMPKGVTPLYFIQALATFSFAILYSSLSLYLTKQLGLASMVSNGVVALFFAFNYGLQLFGGVIGGRWLSNRVLFVVSILIQTVGLLCLAQAETSSLYLGLSLFLVGCGVNTTCYNSILTQRFKADDTRRERAFFISYAAMNVGFCAGFIVSGFFDFSNQYQHLFYACVVINIMTIILTTLHWPFITDVDTPLIQVNGRSQLLLRNVIGVIVTIVLIPVLFFGFNFSDYSNALVVVMSIFMFFVILFLAFKQKFRADKLRIMTYLLLTVTSIIFWMIYFTGPMGVAIFIKNNVDKHLFGYEIATQWLLNINALIIIAGAPLLSGFISRLQSKGHNVSTSMQFVWAFVILAISFGLLAGGVVFSDSQGYTSIYWVIAYFVAQACAELFIGPVGYALIGKIAPVHLQGILMGTWMMVSGVSASISHYFSNAMVKTTATDPLVTNVDYLQVFEQLGLWALGGALCLYLISKLIGSFVDDVDEIDNGGCERTAFSTND